MIKCPECHQQAIQTGHELTCSGCGLVLDTFQPVDDTPTIYAVPIRNDIVAELLPLVHAKRVLNFPYEHSMLTRGRLLLQMHQTHFEFPQIIYTETMYAFKKQYMDLQFHSIQFLAATLYYQLRLHHFPIAVLEFVMWFRAHGHMLTRKTLAAHVKRYYPDYAVDPDRQIQEYLRYYFYRIIHDAHVQAYFGRLFPKRPFDDYTTKLKRAIQRIYKQCMPSIRKRLIRPGVALAIIYLAEKELDKRVLLNMAHLGRMFHLPDVALNYQVDKLWKVIR